MIIVTGGAGFIGSNLIHQLNRAGERNILVVDNLAPAPHLSGPKFLNLAGADYADYMDKREFRAALKSGDFEATKIRAILHQGACSNTLEDDGRYMMDNNFTYSKELLHFATEHKIPFVYASTAAVYGASTSFNEAPENERPLNVYGYSKLVFDNYVRRLMPEFKSTVVGLRYFNVYGPREQHKGRMASVLITSRASSKTPEPSACSKVQAAIQMASRDATLSLSMTLPISTCSSPVCCPRGRAGKSTLSSMPALVRPVLSRT